MAKKKGSSRRASRKKSRPRVRTRFKVMGAVILFWVLIRVLGDRNAIDALMKGDFQTAMTAIQNNILSNFTGSGAAQTWGVLTGLALFTYLLKFLHIGSPMRGVSLT